LAGAFLSVLGAGAQPREARAEYQPSVVLLKPPIVDPIESEAFARLRGELRASSFQLVVIPVESEFDPKHAVNTMAGSLRPAAVFAVYSTRSEAGEPLSLEIWMADKTSGRTFVQRQAIDAEKAPRAASVLAVQAVELLKARLADASLPLPQPPPAPAEPPSPPPTPPPILPPDPVPASEPRSFTVGFGAEAGIGLLLTFGAIEVTWTPLLRLSYGALIGAETNRPVGFSGRLSLAGLGSSAEIAASAGSASVDVSLALLEGVFSLAPAARVEPFVSAAAGFTQIGIEGRGLSPYLGRSETVRTPLSGFGAGLAFEPLEHWSLLLQAQVLFAWRPVVVRLSTIETERIGSPLLALSTGVAATF